MAGCAIFEHRSKRTNGCKCTVALTPSRKFATFATTFFFVFNEHSMQTPKSDEHKLVFADKKRTLRVDVTAETLPYGSRFIGCGKVPIQVCVGRPFPLFGAHCVFCRYAKQKVLSSSRVRDEPVARVKAEPELAGSPSEVITKATKSEPELASSPLDVIMDAGKTTPVHAKAEPELVGSPSEVIVDAGAKPLVETDSKARPARLSHKRARDAPCDPLIPVDRIKPQIWTAVDIRKFRVNDLDFSAEIAKVRQCCC